MNVKDRLKPPTLEIYVDSFSQLQGLDLICYYILRLVNYNLFIFIAGILASLSVNILTSLMTYVVSDVWNFAFLLSSCLFSFLITIFFTKFTIRFIEIQDFSKQAAVQFAHTADDLEEGMTNRTIEKFIQSRIYLRENLLLAIVFSVLLVICMALSFFSANC